MTVRRDRGAISMALLLLLAVVFAGAGLVVDGGRTMAARRHASNTAEAAARAAVATATPVSSFDPVVARRAAIASAQRSGVRASDVVVVVRPDSVRVTVTERRSTVFLVLGGRSTLTVRATGVARIVYSD